MNVSGTAVSSPSFSESLASPEAQAFMTGFPTLVLHASVTVVLLGVGALIYSLLTPWKEVQLIRQGNTAAAVAFGGVLIGLATPLSVSLSVSASAGEILVWGVATLVMQLLAFRLVDVVLTGLPQRIEKNEMSAAIVLVAAKLATALIVAAALTG